MIFEKRAVDSSESSGFKIPSLLHKLAPVLVGGGVGLGTYALARRPIKAVGYPILQKLRKLSKGRMYAVPEGLTIKEWEEMPRFRKFIRGFVYGPELMPGTAEFERVMKKRPGLLWDQTGKFEHLTNIINPGFGSVTGKQLVKAREAVNRLDNKWTEHKFLARHAPGSVPRTLDIQNILKKYRINLRNPAALEHNFSRLQSILKKEFPKGYIIKGKRGDAGTSGNFPTHKTNLYKEYNLWANKLGPKFIGEAKATGVYKGNDTDLIIDYSERPGFKGRTVANILKRNAIVQELLPSTHEFRVHVLGGKAVPYLTSPRYDWSVSGLSDIKKMRDATKFVQNIVGVLPKQHRGLSYAVDVIRTPQGQHKIIETNPGPWTGILDPSEVPTGFRPVLQKLFTGRWARPHAGLLGLGVGGASGGVVAGVD